MCVRVWAWVWWGNVCESVGMGLVGKCEWASVLLYKIDNSLALCSPFSVMYTTTCMTIRFHFSLSEYAYFSPSLSVCLSVSLSLFLSFSLSLSFVLSLFLSLSFSLSLSLSFFLSLSLSPTYTVVKPCSGKEQLSYWF